MPSLEIGQINSKKKYFLVHHDNGLGWHFLDWSIKFLSGKEKDFSFDEKQYINITDNPIENTQAHKHKITFVYTKEQLIRYNLIINKLDNDCAPVVLHNGINQHTVNSKSKDKENLENLNASQKDYLNKLATQRLVELATLAVELGFTVISIDWSDCHKFVPAYQIRQGYDFNTGVELEKNVDIHNLWIKTFFNESFDAFDGKIWDKREQLALCMRPFPLSNFDKTLINTIPNLISVSTLDLWINGAEMFNFSKQSKFNSWEVVYRRWQQLHDVELSEDYWKILDCIVQNKFLDLSSYKLNLIKEAFIQHGLIYKYNLNLKTWNLVKFPDSTSELHSLLEENIHYRDNEYCKNF